MALSLLGRPARLCDGLTRREVIRVGGLGTLGLSLPRLLDSLYKNDGHAEDIHVLLRGSIPGQPAEPLAWARVRKGGRVFYTSLGAQETFQDAGFRRMLANALFWAARREVETKKPYETRIHQQHQETGHVRSHESSRVS